MLPFKKKILIVIKIFSLIGSVTIALQKNNSYISIIYVIIREKALGDI